MKSAWLITITWKDETQTPTQRVVVCQYLSELAALLQLDLMSAADDVASIEAVRIDAKVLGA